jgi:hypothetical protein
MKLTQTIWFENTPLDVEFYYSPPERMTRDYPGAAEDLEIVAVWCGAYNITDVCDLNIIENKLYEFRDESLAA